MQDLSPEEQRAAPRKRSAVRETVETIVVAGLLAVGIRATVAEARSIPSESMIPTLQIGDHLIVEKVTTRLRAPHRGEILVFYPPNADTPVSSGNQLLRWFSLSPDVALIKRVVGLPGETIAVQDGKVWINGKSLTEPYINEAPLYMMAQRTIPADNVFMMGDNRNNSLDSHVWGPLPVGNVIGHAVVRFWPLDRLGLVTGGTATPDR